MRRLQLVAVAAALVAVCLATPVSAQNARATGAVRDSNGRPIRGAIVRAANENARPSQITSTTDVRGRWAMIGLATGQWQFVVEADGFVPQTAMANVRVAAPASLVFTLARDLGPIPGALEKNVAQQLLDANTLREQGRLDQAIAAYQEIRTKNPKLTTIGLVVADAYRRKAAQEQDPAARVALLERAIGAYTDVLSEDAANERARAELASTRAEVTKAGAVKK